MEGDANDEFPPPMLAPKRRNTVLRLYDAPVYRDWAFWLTAVVAITSGFAIATGGRTSAMPVWLDTSLAVLIMTTLFAVLPAWLRLLLRRRLWRIRKRRGQAPGRPAATAEPESGPPANAPVRNPGHTPSTPAKEQARGPVNVNAPSRNNVQAPQREHRQLPYPIARAVRGYDLAATPKEKYDALLDTAEALTITLGVTAAALFRSTNHSEFLARLRDAYVNKTVTQGDWQSLVDKLRLFLKSSPDYFPQAAAALQDTADGAGLATLLTAFVQERNRAAHGSRPRDRHEAFHRLAELSPKLERALTQAGFLRNNPWVVTESSSFRPAIGCFDVTARYVMGDHPDFERHNFQSELPLPDNTFYVLTAHGAVELAPFIVARYCQQCRQEEVCHADRIKRTDGVELKSFTSGHVVFDKGLVERFHSIDKPGAFPNDSPS